MLQLRLLLRFLWFEESALCRILEISVSELLIGSIDIRWSYLPMFELDLAGNHTLILTILFLIQSCFNFIFPIQGNLSLAAINVQFDCSWFRMQTYRELLGIFFISLDSLWQRASAILFLVLLL